MVGRMALALGVLLHASTSGAERPKPKGKEKSKAKGKTKAELQGEEELRAICRHQDDFGGRWDFTLTSTPIPSQSNPQCDEFQTGWKARVGYEITHDDSFATITIKNLGNTKAIIRDVKAQRLNEQFDKCKELGVTELPVIGIRWVEYWPQSEIDRKLGWQHMFIGAVNASPKRSLEQFYFRSTNDNKVICYAHFD